MNLYDMMVQPPTEQDKLRMMSSQLRNQDTLGIIGQATGDKVMSGVGSNLSKSVDDYLKMIQQDRQYQQGRSDKAEQRKILKNYYEAQERQWTEQNKLKGRQIDAMSALKEATLQNKREGQMNKDVAGLADKLNQAGIPGLVSAVNEFDAVLSPYKGAKDIPGIGAIESAAPSWMLSDKGKKIRAALAPIENQLLKARSGAAVTAQELERMRDEFARVKGSDEKTFLEAWNRFKRTYNSVMQGVKARATPEVYAEFINRFGTPLEIQADADPNAIVEPAPGMYDPSIPAGNPWEQNWSN